MDNGRKRITNDLSLNLNFNNKSLDYISPFRKQANINQLSNSTVDINPMHTINDKMVLQNFNPKNFRQKQKHSNNETDSYDYSNTYYYSTAQDYSSSDPLKTTLTTTGADDLPTVHFDSSDFNDNSSFSSYLDAKPQQTANIQQNTQETEDLTISQIPVFRFSFNSSSSNPNEKKSKKTRGSRSLRNRILDDKADAGSKTSSKHGKAPPLQENIDLDTTTTTTTTTSAFNTPAPLFIPDLDTPSDIDLLRGRYDFRFPRSNHQNKNQTKTNKTTKKTKKKKSKMKNSNKAKSTNSLKPIPKKDRKPPPLYIEENKKDSSSTHSKPKYETPLQKAVEEFRQAAIAEKERQKLIDEQKTKERELIRQNQQNQQNNAQDNNKKEPSNNRKTNGNRKSDSQSYKNEIKPKPFHSNDNSNKNSSNNNDNASILSQSNLKISKAPKSAEYAHISIQSQETNTKRKTKSKRFKLQEPPIIIFGSTDDSTPQPDTSNHDQIPQSPVSSASSITTLRTKEVPIIPIESISSTPTSSSSSHKNENKEEKVPLNKTSNKALSKLIDSTTESTFQEDSISLSLSSLNPSRNARKFLVDREEVLPPDEFNQFTNEADSHKTPSLTQSLQPLDSSDVISNKEMLNEELSDSNPASTAQSYDHEDDDENGSPFKFQRPSKYTSGTEFSTTHTDISVNSRHSLFQDSTQQTNKATVDEIEVIDSDSSNSLQDPKLVDISNEPEIESPEVTPKSTIDINDFLKTVKEKKNQSQTIEPVHNKKKKRSNARSTASSINTYSIADESADKSSEPPLSQQSHQNDDSYSSQYTKSDTLPKSTDNNVSDHPSHDNSHNTADKTPLSYIESLTSDYTPQNKTPQVIQTKPKKKKRALKKKNSLAKKQAIQPQELPTVILTTHLDEDKKNEFRFERYQCTQPSINKNQIIPYKEDFYPSIEYPREPIRGWFKFQVNLIPHPDTYDMEQKASNQYSFEKLLKQMRFSE